MDVLYGLLLFLPGHPLVPVLGVNVRAALFLLALAALFAPPHPVRGVFLRSRDGGWATENPFEN